MTGSPYTLEAAREILLGRRSRTVKTLDALLGVGLLAAGPIGLVTGNPQALALWGWVDQKNELIARFEEAVGAGRDKLRKAAGRQRHEVLAAAHTTLVAGSFFAALRELTGPALAGVHLTASEENWLIDPAKFDGHRSAVSVVQDLLWTEIPLPWAGCGFETNLAGGIRSYYQRLADRCLRYFSGFATWEQTYGPEPANRQLVKQIVERALDRYRAEYKALTAEIPEFQIWALFGEHLAEQNALHRLEQMVATLVGTAQTSSERATIADINRAILTSLVVDLDETAEVTAVRVPSVERGYVEPGFRWAVVDRQSLPSQEGWWRDQAKGTDLASFLAAHFASPQAAERPLVVLGHPGSGKSLLTKICAARLSATDAFTTVRVPLRDVPDPSASVYRQIEDVLRESTHGRVEWSRLCTVSQGRVRVVLIDGLDELMQATGATESRYLSNVMDFQRTEAVTGGPVAVMVTSRTLVADLAAIPRGCLVVMLEEFTDEQIDTWAQRWAEANALGVERGLVRSIDGPGLRAYGELARQPLLLLLLAIVAAERDVPPEENSAALYRMLLDDFVRRELARPDQHPTQLTAEKRRIGEFWKLGVVAFGMLNRGQQHLQERDLSADLHALPDLAAAPAATSRDVGRVLDPARRIVGRFFFVSTSEADSGQGGRSYEFLHATFADFLVAHHTVELLRDAASVLSRPSAFQPWNDDLLFALLSHQLIVGFGSRRIDFVHELAGGEVAVAEVLERLIRESHDRWEQGRHADYQPSERAVTYRIAAYTANLVMLRLAVAGGPVPLGALCPRKLSWPAQVGFWDGMLRESGQFVTFVDAIEIEGDGHASLSHRRHSGYYEDMVALLAGDRARAAALAAGRLLVEGHKPDHLIDHELPGTAQRLALLLLNQFPQAEDLTWAENFDAVAPELHVLAAMAAAGHAAELSGAAADNVVRALADIDSDVARAALATVVSRSPDVSYAALLGGAAPNPMMLRLALFSRQHRE
ncbi:NACHT domain-containing protein [Actinoplanes sp. NPDC020271]|uniref:NACHT domain-containing protein n=1 Tax=Actinoplanes sp. NPDC020271 TaxID=3363896 RepID=UPI00378A305B